MAAMLTSLETDAVLRFLREQIISNKINQKEISRATGVHQSQVSRILAGRSKRQSKNVVLLCKYAESMTPTGSSASITAGDLSRAVLDAWDGTQEQAESINALLKAIRQIARR